MLILLHIIILLIVIIIIIVIIYYYHNITHINFGIVLNCEYPVNVSLGIPSSFNFWKKGYIPQTLSFNYIIEPPISIIQTIRNFMFDFRNVKLNNIVLGNGSVQMINAYFYSVKQILKNVKLYHINPTFFEINIIAKLYDIEITNNPDEANLEYICVINNPTGEIIKSQTNSRYKLYDYAYWYDGFTLIDKPYSPYNVDFTFSFSKFGLSGFRLGFLNLTHNELEPYINSYMFSSTLNVNSASYDYFINVFKNKQLIHNNLIIHTNIMSKRWKIINELNKKLKQVLNKQGAYIVMKNTPLYYLENGISGIPIVEDTININDTNKTRLSIIGDNFDCLIEKLTLL